MARQIAVTAPKTVEIIDVPDVECQPGLVRIQPHYLGISIGTEMNTYLGGVNWHTGREMKTRLFHPDAENHEWEYPATLGYANVGEIVEVGPEVEGLSIGQMVHSSASHMSPALARAANTHPIPDGHDPRRYVFAALVGTCINIVHHARPAYGDTVAIFGQGVVGLITTLLLKRVGAGKIIAFDLLPLRREKSLEMGADLALDPRDGDPARMVREANEGRGADIAIEASASESGLHQCTRAVEPKGRVVLASMPKKSFNIHFGQEIHFNGIQITGANISQMPHDIGPAWDLSRRDAWALKVLREVNLTPLITHEYSFEEAAEAYAYLDTNPDDLISVVIKVG